MSRQVFPLVRAPQRNVVLRRQNARRTLLVFLLVFTLIWDSLVTGILVTGRVDGISSWIFLFVFGGVAVVLTLVTAGMLVHTILLQRAFAPPRLMVDHHPQLLGDSFRVALGQVVKRDLTITRAKLRLEGEERATWRRGTSTYSETKVVFQSEQVFEEPLQGGNLIQLAADFTIPADGMHSLKAKNNEFTWKVVYELEVLSYPDVKEAFELEVPPARIKSVPGEQVPPLPLRVLRACDGAELRFEVNTPEAGYFTLGDPVEAVLVIDARQRINCRGVVVQLLWCTSGKGDPEELLAWQEQVHAGPIEPGVHRFPVRATLPAGPACYDGELMHLAWELRATIDLAFRRDPGIAQPIWAVPPVIQS